MTRSIILTTILLASGCAVSVGAAIRDHVQPPPVRYLDVGGVRSNMHTLAWAAAEIDWMLAGDTPEDPASSAAILAQLRTMRSAAEAIDADAASDAHPELASHMGTFILELRRAEEAALRTPPSYYLTGTVVSACAGCHAIAR